MGNTVVNQQSERLRSTEQALVLPFDEVGIADIPKVGGKNASLGEMICQHSDSVLKTLLEIASME